MSRQVQVPLTSTVSENDVSGQELLVNVYPKPSSGGKYPFTLAHTPGQAFFCELPTSPVMGLIKGEGDLFAFTPTNMYQVFTDGTYQDLGGLELLGTRVVMADNGNHIVAVDGIKGFSFNRTTAVLQEITDPNFYPAATVDFQDGYFVFDRVGTGDFFLSELLDVTFDANDLFAAEGRPDNVVAVISDHGEILPFGTASTEFWYNTGEVDFRFTKNKGAFSEKGCAARYTIAQQDNAVYFVGSDLVVYKMAGYVPQRVSTRIVERSLTDVDLSDAYAMVYQEEGHLFYILTIPAVDQTWCYDISTNEWHKREGVGGGQHRANTIVFFDGKILAGDYQNGRIYQLSSKHYTDDNEIISRKIVLPVISRGRSYFSAYSFELDMSSGIGLSSGQGSDPVACIEYSKDGGKKWSNVKKAIIGKTGKYLTRPKVNRIGSARQLTFRVTINEPIPIDIGGAYLEVD